MANKSVVLYQSIKVGTKWILCPVDEDSSHFPKGPFYVSWYDGRKKQMESVGRDPEHALRMANRKRAALAFIAAGGEVKNSQLIQTPVMDSPAQVEQNLNSIQNPTRDLAGGKENRNNADHNASRERKRVETAVFEFLGDCRDRQGKSGYGIAPRTVKAYGYRLGFLVEFKPDAFMDEIDRGFAKAFRRFLRNHPNDLSDRTSLYISQGSIFAGSGVAE